MPEVDGETQVMIRTSERTSFKKCRQAWWWAYVEHLKPIRVSSPLFFGSMAHAALEQWYIPGRKRGTHPAETFEKLWEEWLAQGGEEVMVEDYTAGELGIAMMKNYVLEFGEDKDIEVIEPEMLFQVDVHHPVSGRYLFTYVGTVDGLIRHIKKKRIGFLEHKTGANLDPFGAPLTLDEQNGAYWTFAPYHLRDMGLLEEDQWPDFMMYNRLRKAMADARPKNKDGYALNKPAKADLVSEARRRELVTSGSVDELIAILQADGFDALQLGAVSKSQPTPLFRREFIPRGHGDRVNVFSRAINEAREMQLTRDGILEVYKNPDKHCNWCEFRDMCEVHENGSDWKAMRSALFTTWNPYDEHEIFLSERQ